MPFPTRRCSSGSTQKESCLAGQAGTLSSEHAKDVGHGRKVHGAGRTVHGLDHRKVHGKGVRGEGCGKYCPWTMPPGVHQRPPSRGQCQQESIKDLHLGEAAVLPAPPVPMLRMASVSMNTIKSNHNHSFQPYLCKQKSVCPKFWVTRQTWNEAFHNEYH